MLLSMFAHLPSSELPPWRQTLSQFQRKSNTFIWASSVCAFKHQSVNHGLCRVPAVCQTVCYWSLGLLRLWLSIYFYEMQLYGYINFLQKPCLLVLFSETLSKIKRSWHDMKDVFRACCCVLFFCLCGTQFHTAWWADWITCGKDLQWIWKHCFFS